MRGVNILADAVKITLGPKGRNAVIEKKFGSPIITKDGDKSKALGFTATGFCWASIRP